ncbi:MAG TPA: branched-chain amino acid ABC transporter permease [Stellaceae bacterium]|nr:branched-chain amino acid ABC transporter permease [Stellaceae bacterium]
MPHFTLLAQSLLTGILAGALYGLLALGLSLSWGLLRLVNLGHFAMALLGAYLTWWFGTVYGIPPWWTGLFIVGAFFVYGMGLHWVFMRFRVAEMASMLITFSIAVLLESLLQALWTADFRRYETAWSSASIVVGPLFVPTLNLAAALVAAVLALATWAWLRFTYVGKALRAGAEDAPIAAAFGINHRQLSYLLSGLCAAYAGVAGVFIALIATLAPSEIWTWVGVVFAVVIIGRLGNPLGALVGGVLIGACEAMTMAVVNPAWAPLVSFSVLIALLLFRPKWV